MSTAERLSALDAAFVKLDRLGSPYHVGSVLVFDRAPLAAVGEPLDEARLRGLIGAAIDRLPRYRQRIGRVPLIGHPVWLDTQLALEHHVRFLSLRPPASPRELDDLAGQLFSQDMDRRRPPWQVWFIDGLAGDAIAVVTKVHHALIDGISGVHLLEQILRATPDTAPPPRVAWSPETPSRLGLLKAEIAHRASRLVTLRRRPPGDLRRLAPALGALIARGLHPASDAGINPLRVGRRRAIARSSVPMADVLRVKRAHGVTVNDVVLAAVAGAMRRFLVARGIDVARLVDFRAMVPASTHAPGDTSVSGNHVALMLARLPIDEADPIRRLQRVHEVTLDLKRRGDEVAAGELLVELCDATIPSVLPAILGLALAQRGFNLIVTNVPGPPFPLYLLGARLLSFHPIVNLWPRQTIGIALLSYNGTLYVGLHGDAAALPDFAGLALDLELSFAELCAPRSVVETPGVAAAR